MKIMTEEERKARQWLEVLLDDLHGAAAKHASTILRLLDRPVCPRGEDVPDDVLREMWIAWQLAGYDFNTSARAMIDTLHAHLTAPPKVKREEGWLVINGGDRASFTLRAVALAYAEDRPGSRVVRLVEADDE